MTEYANGLQLIYAVKAHAVGSHRAFTPLLAARDFASLISTIGVIQPDPLAPREWQEAPMRVPQQLP